MSEEKGANTHMTLAPNLDNPKCSPTVLCRHSYVTESDNVTADSA